MNNNVYSSTDQRPSGGGVIYAKNNIIVIVTNDGKIVQIHTLQAFTTIHIQRNTFIKRNIYNQNFKRVVDI